MKRLGPQLFFSLLVGVALLTLACGSSSSHIPLTVTVRPATADAGDFANSEVQFTATAYYNTMPTPVNNVAATWSSCSESGNNESVPVSASGLAQCTTPGTYTVSAFVEDPRFKGICASASNPCAGSCGGVVGTAQLTCP